MRKLLILLTIIVILPLFSLKIAADDRVDELISDFGEVLPDGFEGLADGEGVIGMADADSILSYIMGALSGERGAILSFLKVLLGSAVLMSVAALCHDRLSVQAEICVGFISSMLIFSSLAPILTRISEAISQISGFFAAVIPITVSITALGGGSATASTQAVGMYTALSAVGGIGGEIFLGLSAFGLALSLISALGNDGIYSVVRGLRSLFGWVTGIFTALITAAFSLQTIVSSAADSASMRAVRYAASGLIPVVGSTVSGAISTLAAGLGYARSIVGGGAILVILYMALSPLILLLIYRLALTLGGIFADFSGSAMASRIFSSYRYALDMTVTVYSLSALIYLFEIIIFTVIGAWVL